MGGMEKTTVYLTSAQKQALARAAQAEGRSEAHLIREAIETVTARSGLAEDALRSGVGRGSPAAERVDAAANRPRWMARDEFVARFVVHPADAGLRAELRQLASGSTDDVEIR